MSEAYNPMKDVPLVKHFLRKKNITKDNQYYDDYLQRGLYALVKAKASFNNEYDFAVYATMCIRRAIKTLAKRVGKNGFVSTRRSNAELNTKIEMPTTVHMENFDKINNNKDILNDIIYNDLVEAVKKQTSKMQERIAYIINSRVIDNKTYKEIGQELGISHERVRQLYDENIYKLMRTKTIRELV